MKFQKVSGAMGAFTEFQGYLRDVPVDIQGVSGVLMGVLWDLVKIQVISVGFRRIAGGN